MKNKIKAAILGCTGYTGLEIINILIKHPKVNIYFLGSKNNAGKNIKKFDKRFFNTPLPKIKSIDELNYSEVDVVFFALPHNQSQKIVKKNFGKCIFIDLSADFRLDNQITYKKNYENKHLCPSLLKKFAYGLPELNYKKIIKLKNVAVPGCYPTSILLPLIPLLQKKLIYSDDIIIDSKSGYSGAGKNFNVTNLFKDKNMNFYNYNTNNHRHICEIYQELEKVSKNKVKFSFNPHILPIFRGIMTTMYCNLKRNVKQKKIFKTYKEIYKNNHFIKILDNNDKADFFAIQNNNYCLIKIFNHYQENKIIIVCLIDNLLKGASGQAVQSMNLLFGFKDYLGIK
tara:strand:- start:3620 stop:4645 length:1026 start_codon:yes stop_codon:yes gene_type:complete